MGKIEKTFWWLCFILAIYTTIGFKIVPDILKEQILKNLDENLTQKSSIEKIEFNPYSLNTKIYNYKLGGDKAILSFDKLNIDLGLIRSITDLHANIQEVNLKNLYIDVTQNKNGEINLTKLLKPKKEENTTQNSSSSDIKFLISKLIIENSKIDFTKENQDKPYKLSLNNINYKLRDFGTYQNSLSSNDFTLKINEFTKLAITGAFRLTPFKMYGKIDLKDLRLKELLDYDMSQFNFAINKEANINTQLDYNINLEKDTDVKIISNILNLNNLSLLKDNSTLAKLNSINIKKLDFDLKKQNINIDNLNINNLSANMLKNKTGLNFANLVKATKKEETTTKKKTNEVSKPWKIKLIDTNLKNSEFSFKDSVSSLNIEVQKSNTNIKNLDINGSNININKLSTTHPLVKVKDKNIDLHIEKSNIYVDKIALKENKVDINSINLENKALLLNDLNTYFNIHSSKNLIKANNLKINGGKIDLERINTSFPNINILNIKEKIDSRITNTNINVNKLAIEDKISINSIKLSKSDISFKDRKNNLLLNSDDLQIYLNKLTQNNDKLSINSLRVVEPKLSFLNTQNQTKILANNLDLSISNILNTNKILKITKTTLNKPTISVILPKKPETKKEEETKEKKEIKSEKSNKKINIGPLNIKNAKLNFEDKNLPIAFKTTVSKINGNISEFNNDKASTSKLEVKGVVDEYGTTKITGIVNPNSIKVLTDINMIFRNIEMSNFTPYTGKFIGRELDTGKLDLDLKYNIQKSDLDAQNNVIITKLKLGKNVESKDAVSLPLELAIALLEDSSGVIDINLPISGNIDDPQFSVAPIVWKAFVNLITKALTAPFSLLGAIFGFNENEIKSVNFDFGQSEITPIQKETLDKISKILIKRPNLVIKLEASYDENKDLYALKKDKFDKLISNEIPDKNNKEYENKYLSLLESLYKDYGQKVDSLRNKHSKDSKLNTKSYKKDLVLYIISKQKVDTLNLETMAKQRIVNIKKYLVKEKAIKTQQIKLEKNIKVNTQSSKTSNIDLKIGKL